MKLGLMLCCRLQVGENSRAPVAATLRNTRSRLNDPQLDIVFIQSGVWTHSVWPHLVFRSHSSLRGLFQHSVVGWQPFSLGSKESISRLVDICCLGLIWSLLTRRQCKASHLKIRVRPKLQPSKTPCTGNKLHHLSVDSFIGLPSHTEIYVSESPNYPSSASSVDNASLFGLLDYSSNSVQGNVGSRVN